MSQKLLKTYVYIDVSNIRSACQRSCHFKINFIKLYHYLHHKYPQLQQVRYYEGISLSDTDKAAYFRHLTTIGFTVCSLERKSYTDPAKYKKFSCQKCGAMNKIQISPRTVKLKSNVDVYLATDMIRCAAQMQEPTHFILLSCDGDYVEAIQTILQINPRHFVTILATPKTRKNNCLSERLRKLANRNYKHISLVNIENIKDYIIQ